jgi:hypothetical protein
MPVVHDHVKMGPMRNTWKEETMVSHERVYVALPVPMVSRLQMCDYSSLSLESSCPVFYLYYFFIVIFQVNGRLCNALVSEHAYAELNRKEWSLMSWSADFPPDSCQSRVLGPLSLLFYMRSIEL